MTTPHRTLLMMESPALEVLPAPPAAYRLAKVRGWRELMDALAAPPPACVVLLDPYAAGRRADGPSARLREVMWRRPSVPVVAALSVRDERLAHVATLLDWGVSEILDLELERTPGALALRLDGARGRPLKRRVESILSTYVSHPATQVIRAACDVAVDGGGASELAARFGVEARTVSAWCRRQALPPPRRLQAWVRVLLAATLLEEADRTVTNAARCSGYAGDNALRRALRELADADPATDPRAEIFPRAAQRFGDELRDLREIVRAHRRMRTSA